MPRFVVLQHDSPRGLHWDFMLERDRVLLTWALPVPPDTRGPIGAEALPDHRPAYLDYEGPVSGGRGSVTRWDGGSYEVERESEDELAVVLAGRRLNGRVVLAHLGGKDRRWQFRYSAVPDR
jgi:DNA polymerase Ligase (LigD)